MRQPGVLLGLILLAVCCLPVCAQDNAKEPALGSTAVLKGKQAYSVWVVGNSYTKRGELYLANVLTKLSASNGSGPKLKASAKYGSNTNLGYHWRSGAKRVAKGKYDAVVLQEHSQHLPGKYEDTLKHVTEFARATRKHGGKVVLFMVWAPRKQQDRLKAVSKSYARLGREVGCAVAPVGLAWRLALKEQPEIELYHRDGKHPAPLGFYLNACVLYATLTGKAPVGLGNAGIGAATVERRKALQDIAWRTVKSFRTDAAPVSGAKATGEPTTAKPSVEPPKDPAPKSVKPGSEAGPTKEAKVARKKVDAAATEPVVQKATPRGKPGFSEKPKVTASGSGCKVTFSVRESTDAEVKVLDAKGRVVRHLAAGVLGDSAPKPFRKGLKQELVWDGKDDAGAAAKGGPFKVEVALGMHSRLDKVIGWSGKWLGELCGITTGPDGMLYIMHRCDWLPHRHSWAVSAFDKEGKYHHQVYPGPGNLPPEKRKGWPWVETTDGQHMPIVQHLLNRSLYPAARFHRRNFSVVTRDGRLIIPTGARAGLRSEAPDVRGGRRLLVLNTDGSVPEGFIGPVFAPANYGGYAHLALTPDEKHVYISGLFEEVKRKGRLCHVVWKMPLEPGGKRTVFLGELFKPGKGEKAFNDPQGLAVDKDGNLYVADCGNDRVAVFKPDGSFLDEIPVKKPDQVKVSLKTGEIVVLTVREKKRRLGDSHWYSHPHNWKLTSVVKFAGLRDKKKVASYGPLPERGSGGGAFVAMDDSGDSPRLYVGGLGWRDSNVRCLAEKDGKLQPTRRIAGFSIWGGKPEGDMGFSGDVAYLNGTLLTSGGSSWGFRGDRWASFDAGTGKYKGYWPRGKSKSGPKGGHAELVSGKDGNTYTQSLSGVVSRFRADGKPFPFASRKGHVIGGLYQKHSRQTGLFVDAKGTIYVPSGYQEKPKKEGKKPLNHIERTNVVVIGADGKLLSKSAIEVHETRVAGLAVDREGNICLGARAARKGKDLPSWIAGKLPADLCSQAKATYQQVATVFKFQPSGGSIKADPQGKWTTVLHSKPQTAKVSNALWAVRGGLVPRKWGCYCETTRFDIDPYGRLFIPDTLRFSVLVVDRAGNQVARIGGYGNMDHRGPGSPCPTPEIAFAWPLSTRCAQGKVFVADLLNCRLLSVRFDHAVKETCALP